jgi:hypothetical protein
MTPINKKDNRHQFFVILKQKGNFLGYNNPILKVKGEVDFADMKKGEKMLIKKLLMNSYGKFRKARKSHWQIYIMTLQLNIMPTKHALLL